MHKRQLQSSISSTCLTTPNNIQCVCLNKNLCVSYKYIYIYIICYFWLHISLKSMRTCRGYSWNYLIEGCARLEAFLTYTYIHVCLSISIYLSSSLCVCMCMFLWVYVCMWGKLLCGVCHHCSILAQLVELFLGLIYLNEIMSIFHPSPHTSQSLSLYPSLSLSLRFSVFLSIFLLLSLFLPLSKFLSLLLSLFISVYIMYIYNPFSGFVLRRSQGAKPAWQSLNRKSLKHRLNSMKGLSIVLANK